MIVFDPILSNFTSNEKNACFLLLSLLVESSDSNSKNVRNEVLGENAKMFRVSPGMFQHYIDNSDPSEIKSTLRFLSDDKLEYLIVVTHGILNSTVITDHDLKNTEELFANLGGIPSNRFRLSFNNLLGNTRVVKVGSRKIYYSKYKHKGLFYSSGQHIVEIFDNETITIDTPKGKRMSYKIIVTERHGNDTVFFLQSIGGTLGYYKMMPLGKAELNFEEGTPILLKV